MTSVLCILCFRNIIRSYKQWQLHLSFYCLLHLTLNWSVQVNTLLSYPILPLSLVKNMISQGEMFAAFGKPSWLHDEMIPWGGMIKDLSRYESSVLGKQRTHDRSTPELTRHLEKVLRMPIRHAWLNPCL